jgi:UDP-N-acetylglucosamine acyltransferase
MTVHKTAIISKNAKIAENVEIGPNVVIEDNVEIAGGVKIYANAYITGWTTIGENCQIHMGAVIGHLPQDLGFDENSRSYLKIGKGNVFREYTTVHRSKVKDGATIIGDNNFFMGFSHIAHDCRIGNNVIICNGVLLAGHVEVEDRVFMGGSCGVHQFSRVGKLAMVVGLSALAMDLPPYMILEGRRTVIGYNVVGLRRAGYSNEAINKIRQAFKLLYKSDHSVARATEEIEKLGNTPEITHLVKFIRNSKRGICHGQRAGK